jgi:hypothetical protein
MTEYYSWDIEPGSMSVVIKKNGKRLFSFFLGEAMETAGRVAVMRHVEECDSTPWLSHWHNRAWEILKEHHGNNN